MINQGSTLQNAAEKSGMDVKTAKKYLDAESPFRRKARDWKTRPDPFEQVWPEIEELLEENPRLEAKTVLLHLTVKYPGRFHEGQLRTLQRKFKNWKGCYGASKEVYFDQKHFPGDLSESDFTSMSDLGITISGAPFPHLLYHFVLTYSNWEDVTICYSENLESLLEGLQNAFWRLGGVPKRHRSDRLSAAVRNFGDSHQFTTRYEEMMRWYGVEAEKIQAGRPNENGDVEQSHYRLKKAIDQLLMLRGSRDFSSLKGYRLFLTEVVRNRNQGRVKRFEEELSMLKDLPDKRLPDWSEIEVKVSRGSIIRVRENSYSVPSRLIGETVDVQLKGGTISVFYAGKCIEELPRLSGKHRAKVDYRHVIDWLMRKPGAFEHYRYREELYPSTIFRTAYDLLKQGGSKHYVKDYLLILKSACENGEKRVEDCLRKLIKEDRLSIGELKKLLALPEKLVQLRDVAVGEVDLFTYDDLLSWEV